MCNVRNVFHTEKTYDPSQGYKFASKLDLHAVKLPYQTCPFQYLDQPRLQAKPANLEILIDIFLFPLKDFSNNQYQSGSFSLINVGGGFHSACLVFPLFSFATLA